jgi:hypothetical protein
VWQRPRRLQRLEKEVAEARTAQASLQRRIDVFERIAAAAGTVLDDTVPLEPVPPSLLAAARDPQGRGSPVCIAVVGGDDVIAVIGDEGGDPGAWWSAIQRLTSRLRDAS